MLQKNMFVRVVTLTVGLLFMALGVALSVRADLGVSPISAVPYVYSLYLPMTIGELTIVVNAILVILQILLLRRKFRLVQLVQLPAVAVFGYLIDWVLPYLSILNMSSLGWQILWCLLGCVALGFGIALEIKSKLTYLPGEGIVIALVAVIQKEFSRVKIWVDSSLVFIGVVSSFLLLHNLEGIGVGTLIAALFVGYCVKFCSYRLSIIEKWFKA